MVLHQSTDLTILSLIECSGRIVTSMCVHLQRGRKSEELQVVPQVPELPLQSHGSQSFSSVPAHLSEPAS